MSSEKPKSFAEEMGVKYIKKGDYYYPDLIPDDLPPEPPLGKFGEMKARYLLEYKPVKHAVMLTNRTLYPYLLQVDKEAEEMLERLIKQMAKEEGVTESMKSTDMLGWVGKMNNIKSRATEIVIEEFINN